MIIKFNQKTGKIIGTMPEAMIKPSGTTGHINIKSNGKRDFKKKNEIRSVIVDGETALKVVHALRSKQLSKLKVKKKKGSFVVHGLKSLT